MRCSLICLSDSHWRSCQHQFDSQIVRVEISLTGFLRQGCCFLTGTEYCSDLYNHGTQGDRAILTGPHSTNQDDLPILREEVEAAVKSPKEGKSAGVDNIPAELVQAGGEAMIYALHIICSKIWQTGE